MDRIGLAPGANLTGLEQNDNTRTGATSMADFEGSYEECEAKAAELRDMGASDISIKNKGNGYWTVQAAFPFGFDGEVTDFGVVPSVHELDTTIAQISVYRAKKPRKYLTGEQLGLISNVVTDWANGVFSKPPAGKTPIEAAYDSLANLFAGTGAVVGRTNAQAIADGKALFRQVACYGMEDATEYTSIYKRTLTAATPEQVKASFEGVGMIWTTAEVMDFEGLDPDGFFQLDAGMQWLKSKPTVLAVAGQKTQITYSYTEFLIASGLLYDAYNAAVLLDTPTP